MKTKRSKRGRKPFSAGKQISPDNTVDDNINFAAMGVCAAQPLRGAFQIVALWEKMHACPAPIPPQAKAIGKVFKQRARSHEEKLLALLRGSLSRIAPEVRKALFSAVTRLDSQPFHDIATAIDVARSINESGAFQTMLVRAELLAQELGFTRLATLTLTRKEFASEYNKQFGGTVNTDFLCRECKRKLGFGFKPDKVGRKLKNSDNSR